MKTCEAIKNVAGLFIKWPERHEMREIANHFSVPNTIGNCTDRVNKSNVKPNFLVIMLVLGLIDGSLIEIIQPLQQCAAYTSRKKFCAVTLQAICNHKLQFTSVSTGWPGSMHDSRIYTNSTIGQTIEDKLAGTDYHILGDAAYPLSKRLMKGYPR